MTPVAPPARITDTGYGSRYRVEAAPAWARDHDARRIFRRPNTVPAIRRYERFGFRTIRRSPHPEYDRADIGTACDL